ncbi:MAG: cytochrome c [Gammaproteobacteria bacterium]|nr:cytochrome c [Gammaproteobacteria bacterium]
MKRFVSGVALVAAGIGTALHAQESADRAARVEQGRQVYEYWCEPCHGRGLGLPGFGALPGTHQLQIKYRDTDIPAVLDERTDLVPAFIETIVRQGVSFMPQFRKTEISDDDLDALSAYLTRNNPDKR